MKTDSTSTERLIDLVELVVATAELLGQSITPRAAEIMADDLLEYSDEAISKAMQLCRRELTGKLTLAAIVERIARADGFPSANEAWAIALSSSDENNSTFLLNEINRALMAAQPVLDAGDKIGARMAFIDAYNRNVDQARQLGNQAKWSLSPGWDPEGRKQVIIQAQIDGRITQSAAALLLGEHCPEPATTAKLLEHKEQVADIETAIKHLDNLKSIVSFSSAKARQARIMAAETERAEFEAHRSSEVERLQKHHRQGELH